MPASITSHTRHTGDGTPRRPAHDLRRGPSALPQRVPSAHARSATRTGEDGPEYGWLYGGSTPEPGGPPGAEDPEPTRVMPAISRPTQRAPRPRPAAQRRDAGRAQSPGAARPAGAAAALDRRRPAAAQIPWQKVVVIVARGVVVFLVAVPIWAWSQIDKVDASPAGARPAEQPGTTYLLVGSDSRRG